MPALGLGTLITDEPISLGMAQAAAIGVPYITLRPGPSSYQLLLSLNCSHFQPAFVNPSVCDFRGAGATQSLQRATYMGRTSKRKILLLSSYFCSRRCAR